MKDIRWFDSKMENIQNKFVDFIAYKKKINPWKEAFKIIVIYLIIGSLWILISDKLVHFAIQEEAAYEKAQLYKGWFYVCITGILFYFIINRKLVLFRKATDTAIEAYEELSITHEELIAMDEELTIQYDHLKEHRDALVASEQRYALAVEGANDGIWDWDIANNCFFCSIKKKSTFGYLDNEQEDAMNFWDKYVHPEDRIMAKGVIETYLQSQNEKSVYKNMYRFKTKSGEYRNVISHGKAIWDEEGNPIRMAGSHTDITDQIKIQENLSQEKKLSESIVKEAPMLIVVMDEKGRIKEFNPFAEKVLGYQKRELLNTFGLEILLGDEERARLEELTSKDWSEKRLPSYELNVIHKEGHLITTVWRAKVLYDKNKKIKSIVAIGIDITEKRMIEDRLHTLAYYDKLTQLPNRALFEERVKQEIERAKQEEITLALVYLDMDNFKHINDTMGHLVGDKLLVHIARILAENIENPHIIARLGGDEFAILLEGVEDYSQVVTRIKSLLEQIKKPWTIQGKEFYITMSVGISLYPQHGKDYLHLMQSADTAVFNTKENGKDGICVFEPNMREKTWKYMEMANQLRSAIQNQEFELYYQPQVELTTGEVIGVEALIRWNHPEKGFISPMEFIPFAEETGKIGVITDWVFETACMQSQKWEQQGYTNLKMSINLSSKLLTQKGLVGHLKKLIQNPCIKNPQLEIEITETAVVANLERAIEVLNELKKLGATIALDDFGTGYSSLTYLQKLPIDILKVDREFIRDVVKEDDESYIFKTIVGLAHNLGLKVVAEGVETKEQLAFLVNNGCDIGQGYYFSRPIPAKQMEAFFDQYGSSGLIINE